VSWTARGSGGSIYSLGDPVGFSVLLEPRDDGWVWAAPEWARYWLSTPGFDVYVEDEWRAVVPERVQIRSGSALFPRCLTTTVRATGQCRPASKYADVGGWRVEVEVSIHPLKTLDGDGVVAKRGDSTLFLESGVECPPPAYVWLPHGNCVVVGVGDVFGSTVVFNDEGVVYDPCWNA
jgi:hypothetical protein